MIIVCPIVSAETKHLESWVSVLEYLGGLDSFPIKLVPSIEALPLVEPYIERLRLLGQSCEILDVNYQEANSWPLGPNRHWVSTVYALESSKPVHEPGDCWFWMEQDCWPRERGWAQKLADAYSRAAASAKAAGKNNYFVGKIVKTPHRSPDGRVVYDPEGYDDSMMMGCAVYCAGMSKNPFWRAQANSLRDWSGSIQGFGHPNGWDVELRTFFRNSGWTHTDLIGDRWNTGNYRIEDGALKCDALPTPFKNRAHNDTDITGAALIHGVKDDSLAKLILSGAFGNKLEPAPSVQEWLPQTKAAAPENPVTAPPSDLEKKFDIMTQLVRENFQSIKARLDALEAPSSMRPPQESWPNPTTGETPQASPKPILDQIKEHVYDKRCMRLNELAKKLKVKPDQLEPLIEGSDEFVLQRPLKWVKRKEAA